MKNNQILNNKEFHKLIGGLKKISKDEKKLNLEILKVMTDQSIKKEFIELELEVFSKSYPDSLEYVNKYLQILTSIKMEKAKHWKAHGYKTSAQAEKEIKSQLEEYTLKLKLIYIPLIIEEKIKLDELMEKLKINLKELSSLLETYKEIITTSDLRKRLPVFVDNIPINISTVLANEIINYNLTKKEFFEKYGMEIKKFDPKKASVQDEYYQIMNDNIQINKESYDQYQIDLIDKMGVYLKQGIPVEDKCIPFTMLDYYSLTSFMPEQIIGNLSKIKIADRTLSENKSRALSFLKSQTIGRKIKDAKEIVSQNISFVIQGKKVEIDQNIAEKVLQQFSDNNIPFDNEMIFIALQRYARQQPIMPLLQNNKKVQVEKSNNKLLIKQKNK